MDHEVQLKLQAFLDGELPEAEAREIANLIARDREAVGLVEELRNTGNALQGFEEEIRLPESREFFWSKIQREIERAEMPAPKAAAPPVLSWLRRLMVPVSALAAVFVIGMVLMRSGGPAVYPAGAAAETALADSGAFTYRDYAKGTTLVWLSYPADNEVAQSEDVGTVQ